jgi:TRAP-type transport system periplasmic protein
LQQGVADFAIGSTINWSAQVKELNLFVLPFLFPNYASLDAVQSGEPGRQLFRLMEQSGVIPLAWGENGFRELTNAKREVRRPEDLQGIRIRVVGIPIFVEVLRALGATAVSMNWNDALVAFRQGTVDGQENPLALIIPYRLWEGHRYVTLWHYAIDPLILAVSAKTWASLSAEDRVTVRKAAEEVMAGQKREAREGLDDALTVLGTLQQIYAMQVTLLSAAERKAFRDSVPHPVSWTRERDTDIAPPSSIGDRDATVGSHVVDHAAAIAMRAPTGV